MPPKKQLSILSLAQWLLPVLLSLAAGWGGVRFAQGADAQRLSTVERDVREAKTEHGRFVTRDEFGLLRDDISDIKTDVRELRRAGAK
ncbi:MAG: hypothetical protein ABW208_10225 [Pyrinomonadaceae bacterium]